MRIVASTLLFIGFAVLIDAADKPNKLPSITDDCGNYVPSKFHDLIQVNSKLTYILSLYCFFALFRVQSHFKNFGFQYSKNCSRFCRTALKVTFGL